VQQAAPPPPGAACCRPGDGDARPALTGHQQSPQVRQGVVLRCGRFRRRYNAAKESSTTAPRRRRHPSATPPAGTVTGTARGTNPAEPGGRPAARPGRPCAPLLTCARTPPARGAPGWAHRFGSPVLPIKIPGRGHRRDSAGSQKVTIPVRLGRNKNLSAYICTLGQHRQEVKSMNKMNQEERRRTRAVDRPQRARLFYLLR
jgi:hypothetical protein